MLNHCPKYFLHSPGLSQKSFLLKGWREWEREWDYHRSPVRTGAWSQPWQTTTTHSDEVSLADI